MKSRIYECRILHARKSPKAHRFVYRIFLFAFDLSELAELHSRLRWFSLGRRNLYSFRDGDYLPASEKLHNPSAAGPRTPRSSGPLHERIAEFLRANGIDLAGGRIVLVTLPRIAGHLFNPVSFYFCQRADGSPAAAIAEVTNTFREMKPFLLGPGCLERRGDDNEFTLRVPKQFYVSPFSDVDVSFDFHLQIPNGRLNIRIDDYEGADRTLTSVLTGESRELTDARLLWYAFKYPLISVAVVGRIHWHAFRLWLKRVPWFAKASRAGDQRDLYRPHESLSKPNDNKIRPIATTPAASTGK